ncbi:MAG: AMP-binding protein, partial [Janthinobacterium sp.]
MNFAAFYQRSIDTPEAFWREEAAKIAWNTPFSQVLDYSRPPFAKWFVGGTTNLCHNAVDRWVGSQGDAPALIAISTETNTERSYSFRELQREVERCAAILLSLGVVKGDRVLIYMPMIAEAAFAMLACARIGAVHSVVFGGFAANSLASRIDDAQPKLVFSADAGSRNGKAIAYKPLLDEAIRLSAHQPQHVLLVDRHLVPMALTPGRDVDYATLREQHLDAQVPVVWLESNEPSYVLYTSGTTGKPKGVQRDV